MKTIIFQPYVIWQGRNVNLLEGNYETLQIMGLVDGILSPSTGAGFRWPIHSIEWESRGDRLVWLAHLNKELRLPPKRVEFHKVQPLISVN